MVRRLISANASEVRAMNKHEKLISIRASEGRVIAAETIGNRQNGITFNASAAEINASFGADMILMNGFDVYNPIVQNLPCDNPDETIRTIQKLTGRLVGINLEPVGDSRLGEVEQIHVPEGRQASVATAQKARDMGVDFILLTGNPGTGVTNETILNTLQQLKKAVGDDVILCAGKMHAAGSLTEAGNHIISKEMIKAFAEAGADVILFPAPGTVPGVTADFVQNMIEYAHELGTLTMTSIGTSQEGADEDTIRRIALMCKMCGTDIHHIGDGGYSGCVPENLMAYSIAIRGKVHTYNRMATSPLR